MEYFKYDTIFEFEHLNKWLKANRLSLNFDKIRSMQFTATNWPQIELNVSGCKELIPKSYDTKFLGIHVLDSTLGL